jgi:hypothetical protein
MRCGVRMARLDQPVAVADRTEPIQVSWARRMAHVDARRRLLVSTSKLNGQAIQPLLPGMCAVACWL